MNEDIQAGRQLLEADPLAFEKYVLVALNKDEELWERMSRKLCIHPTTSAFVNDFMDESVYILYRALKAWREQMFQHGSSFSPIASMAIGTQLLIMSVNREHLVDPADIDDLKKMWDELMTAPADEAVALVKPAWRSWLLHKKARAAILDVKRCGAADITSNLQQLEQIKTQMDDNSDAADGLVAFGDVNPEENHLERIELGKNFRRLNSCLGGGLGKTEHIMFIAPTGSGKTVLACQIAADVASSGHTVLLITTEQPAYELQPRIISALGSTGSVNIPFDLVKDNQYESKLSEAQYASYKRVQKAIGNKLIFCEWMGKGWTVQNDLERIIANTLKKYPVEVVILDWIGGALSMGLDKDNTRLAYLSAATVMKEVAVKYKLAAISMAQANASAVNQVKVTEKHIAEAQTIHREAVACFGISALRATDAGDAVQAAYSDDQVVYCIKSRKSMGTMFHVKRDFARQRFEDM